MPHFFIILLKINLVLILFAAAYYLILRRLTFYVINRIFLAFGILFSTIYPFIDLTDFFHRQNQNVVAFVPEINQQVKSLVPSGFIGEYWQWIGILFYIGVVFMAFRLIVQFVSLYKMHKKSAPGSVANFQVRILDEAVSPFSFWQTVYINPSLHKERELKTILEHEQIHVKEWHSLDIILAELSVVFYWFNPGVWLMKRAVKENLEFITDEKILKKGVDKKAYQYSLLDVGNLMPAVEIVNNFNLSDLKKRIKMMNARRSSKLTLSRYMLVLPVLLLTTLAFTVSKKDIKKHFAPIEQALITAKIMEAPKTEVVIASKKYTARKKKAEMQVLNIKIDTARKFQVIIDAINLSTDSLNSTLPDFNAARALSLLKQEIIALPEELKGKVTGRMIMIKRDSVHNNDGVKSIENLNFTFKRREQPILAEGKAMGETIVVQGQPTTRTKLPDLSSTRANTTFYLNGKEISAEDLNKIKAAEIKGVNIKKDTQLSEVHIIGYGKKTTNP
ncbi:M56 family metallopeptidase [Pedobacter polaris]|uniref:M56 family metallopeptidase n=1 Tax=Pedobacter polaris TaxID=2571273 RepID=A0A4U1CR06_9SPHI|nr:M56 family metallopeptidase [Pedobacter polaris]TKC10567.1 M56 family metallopeptidase [Pedobacter polaris]